MENKSDKLNQIMGEVYADAKSKGLEAWFYPEYEGVKGFSGTSEIILLGLNPSYGKFPSKKDKRLYSLLKEKGLENIHITDFIKIRAKNKEVKKKLLENPSLIKSQTEFLKKEIELLSAKILIAMGEDCEKLIIKYLPNINTKILRIKHYGYRWDEEDRVFSEISNSLSSIILSKSKPF